MRISLSKAEAMWFESGRPEALRSHRGKVQRNEVVWGQGNSKLAGKGGIVIANKKSTSKKNGGRAIGVDPAHVLHVIQEV